MSPILARAEDSYNNIIRIIYMVTYSRNILVVMIIVIINYSHNTHTLCSWW